MSVPGQAGGGVGPRLGILSALAPEQEGLVELLNEATCVRHAGREFWCGQLHGKSVVVALSRIGKVAAATTAAAMVERFGAVSIVFTGVAGGIGDGVRVGDVVVGSHYLQHDMDASPLFPRFEVPLTGTSVFAADVALVHQLVRACGTGLDANLVGGASPSVHHGLIVSGDRFVNGAAEVEFLRSALRNHGHNALAVEMEGAAVAQTCADYGIPFAAVRTISDRADDTAHVDFQQFVETVASVYARNIIGAWLSAN
jgi:adenosylhomocysteine nucleosidase